MAAEARAESPAPAPPPLPVPEKRAVPEDGGEERPEPKRRRACVAALDSVSCAASGEVDGHGDGSSFSFQHARGCFVALETTPKFGSFNPPAAAEQRALDPKPAPPAGEGSPQRQQQQQEAASARGDGVGKDGNSQSVGADGQGQT